MDTMTRLAKECDEVTGERGLIAQRIEEFCRRVQSLIDAVYAKHYDKLTPPKITVEYGKRYARIIKAEASARSVYCFIDTNGDILKAASWRTPAKHVRGSILADDFGMSAVNDHGAHYLR